MSRGVALCSHFAIEHFRGGEKWLVEFANRLVADGVDVDVYALPYAPDGQRRVDAEEVLEESIEYHERWRHDVSDYDTVYAMYTPGMGLCVADGSDTRTVAGIHSWAFVTDSLFESHYGLVPTIAKLCYRAVGPPELRRFDAVHSVTPVYDSPHPDTTHVPNFVDTELYHPDRADLAEEFTVLVTAAHIPEKGWDVVTDIAELLPKDVRLVATGDVDHPGVEGLGFLSREELADAYSKAHLLLHPTRVDTDSMAINEAHASGTPTLASALSTHTRWDEAAMQADATEAYVERILELREEVATAPERYAARCRLARSHGLTHDQELLYRRLRELLFPDWETDAQPVRRETGTDEDSPGVGPSPKQVTTDGGVSHR